ncbi:MAG: glycosyl hydrolase 115 family protein [Clostridiales bacterium]|nr:glycosyl hydrolase 115 family protein [Clostridiales bacterium]
MTQQQNAITISCKTGSAPIITDTASKDYYGLKLAADAAANDIYLITGSKPDANFQTVIIAGTLEDSIISNLNLPWEIKPSLNSTKSPEWERYQIKVIEGAPNEGVQTKIVIAGSDKRGVIYGLFHITQDLCGVSPWVYWADVLPAKKDTLSFTKDELETTSKTPSVKYRGFFLNDEAPSLTNFVKNRFGECNYLFYANVCELILRLKANYLWPAMWNNCFSGDGILKIENSKDNRNADKLPPNERDALANARIAHYYGVVVGLSHHEPMCRSGVEWQRLQAQNPPVYNKPVSNAPINEWNYFLNSANIYDFWKDGYARNKNFEETVTIGMRGENDHHLTNPDGSSFTLGQNINLLKRVITDQKEILKAQGGEGCEQMLVIYKEVETYWYGTEEYPGINQMPELADDIMVLCEDNNGYLRTLPKANERNRRWGMYYHFDYVGCPKSYMWINVTPLQRIWNNMTMAYDYSIRDLWIVNAGDLKPMEFPLSYFCDLAYDYETHSKINITDKYTENWVRRQFAALGLENGEIKKIANLITGYTNMNGRRRPEHISETTFHAENYNEARIELEKALKLEKDADEMWEKVKNSICADSFFQLVYYPAKATAVVNKLWLYMTFNKFYANSGSPLTNNYAQKAENALKLDAQLMEYYNKTMSGGYWENMMSQNHYDFKSWSATTGVTPKPVYMEGDMLPRMTFLPEGGVISITANHYAEKEPAGEASWEEIEFYGKSGSTMKMFPTTSFFENPKDAPYLKYSFYIETPGKYELTMYFGPSNNVYADKVQMRCALRLDGGEFCEISALPAGYLSGVNENAAWGQSVLNSGRALKVNAYELSEGLHNLRVYGMDAGVLLQKLVLANGELKQSFFGPPETFFID